MEVIKLRIKKLSKRSKDCSYVLIDKAILQALNFEEYVSFEVKNNSIIIKPYYGEVEKVDKEYGKRSRKKIL